MAEMIKSIEEKVEAQILLRREQFALSFTRYAAYGVGIATVATAVMWLLLPSYTQLLLVIGMLSLATAGLAIYPFFHHRRQVTVGAFVALGPFLLGSAVNLFLVPEIGFAVTICYIFTMIVGNLWLGDKNGRWPIAASILLLLANIILPKIFTLPWFTPLAEIPGLIINLIFSTVAAVIIAVIIRYLVVGQEEQFRLVQRANLNLQNTVAEYVAFVDQVEAGNLDGQLTLKGEVNGPLVKLGDNINRMVAHLRQRVTNEQEARLYQEQTVANYLAFVKRVAEGDLTARLTLNGGDDALTILGRNLNGMAERLGELTYQIRQTVSNLSASSTEILAATTQQASAANEQSAAIAQTSTTIDEVRTIVEQAFAKAQAVAEQSQRTRDISRAGQQAVTDAVESMNQIKEKVEGIAENILALSEQTQQIGEIIASVNELASQSNLLALNASVEAARAGEHGKGFAVVALEVRNLAEQSKQATAQVKSILNEIQRATNAAVMATEEGTKGVDAGAHRTGQTGETIQQLARSIAESANAAQQIVASAQQQTTGMEQIALAMQNINQATMQSLASTRQTEKAAQDLAAMARQMEALIARYKLN